jgi:anti-sigma-K factor RskA
VEPEAIHELTAAYALDALEEHEERQYEEHLARCRRCREELAALRETAGALAYGVESPPPPPQLRDRILERARGERSSVVPLRPRRGWPAGARVGVAVAAVAAAAAVALAIWAVSLSRSLDRERSAAPRAVPVASASGRAGSLVVARNREAVLVLSGIRHAPRGKTYEVWVIRAGKATPAGLFAGGAQVAVPVTRPVPEGATLAVTLERAGGVAAPTKRPFLSAQT